MQPSWVSDEEFGNGHLDLKNGQNGSKSSAGNSIAAQGEPMGARVGAVPSQHSDSTNSGKDQTLKRKLVDGRLERGESSPTAKSDQGHVKLKASSSVNGSDAKPSITSAAFQPVTARSIENKKQVNEFSNKASDENMGKAAPKNSTESEVLCWPIKKILSLAIV